MESYLNFQIIGWIIKIIKWITIDIIINIRKYKKNIIVITIYKIKVR